MKANIRHHGYRNFVISQRAIALHILGTYRNQMIAINYRPRVIYCNQAITITVKCDTQIGIIFFDKFS